MTGSRPYTPPIPARALALLAACLATLAAAPAAAQALDPAMLPPPVMGEVRLDPESASRVALRTLGLQAGEPAPAGDDYRFRVEGFRDGRPCPLEGVRDVRCGEFAWRPSGASVHARARLGALSGHLARNLAVRVGLQSDDAGVASGTLHGVLVYPGPVPEGVPAFAWYVGRDARPLGADLQDVDGDGALDLLYTYVQRLPGGRRVVARDVWSFRGLKAEKLVSSGEKLSGLGGSTFDGVPLHEDGPGQAVRGAFRFEDQGPGRPRLGVFDRGRLRGARSGFDLRVVADLGEGWREVLAGAAPQPDPVEGEGPGDCRPGDVPPEAPVGLRRRLLELESACRDARAALDDGPRPAPWRAPGRLRAAAALDGAGLPMAALGLRQRAVADFLGASPAAFLAGLALSMADALRADRALVAACGAGGPCSRLDSLEALPAFRLVAWPLEQAAGLLLSLARSRVPPAGSGAPAGRGPV